jgi:hypothetical protein
LPDAPVQPPAEPEEDERFRRLVNEAFWIALDYRDEHPEDPDLAAHAREVLENHGFSSEVIDAALTEAGIE